MLLSKGLLASASLALSAVKASVIPSTAVTALTPRDRHSVWDGNYYYYPPNKEVCAMIANHEEGVWLKSGAGNYFSDWMSENGGLRMFTLRTRESTVTNC